MTYDIGIIGGGVAGLTAALEAKSLGLKVVLFEKSDLGGLSFNGGEVVFREFFEIIEDYRDVNLKTILNVDKLLDSIIDKQEERIKGYLRLFKGLDEIDFVYGKALIVNKNEVLVDGESFKFDKLILAHGSTQRIPKVKGIEEALNDGFAIMSSDILSLNRTINSIVVVGSGRVAFQLAVIFSTLGVKVHILSEGGYLKNLDEDFKDLYISKIMNDNIVLMDDVNLLEVKDNEIHFLKDGKAEVLKANNVVIAMGYEFNDSSFKSLNLEIDKEGIITNDYLETNVSGVYAIGSANNKLKLSNLAITEAVVSVNHIIGHKNKVNYDNVVISVFGFTSYAYFGLSETKIKELGIPYYIKIVNPQKEISKQISLEYVKIMVSKETNEILGLFILGSKVSEEMNAILRVINGDTQIEYDNNFQTFTDSHYIGQTINNYFKEFMFNTINNKLKLYYQPKYRLVDNKLIGAEVLSRFMIDGKLKSPLPLIKSFEKNNMIVHVDLKVIDNAVKFISELESNNDIDDNFKLSINISPHTLKIVDVKNINDIINKYQVSKNRIIFEITERDTEHLDLTEQILIFKENGYFISIDDFSIGNSSLPLLKQNDVYEVKIDIGLLPTDVDVKLDCSLYKGVVKILKQLNLKIVAEGVETLEQLEFLKTLEIDYAQGYYLNRPMSELDFENIIKK